VIFTNLYKGLNTSISVNLIIYFFSSLISLNKADLNIDNSTLNNNAEKKLVTTNPPTKLAAIKMMIAFITKRNNPSVRIVAGSVKKISSGFTNIFKTAIANATQIAVDIVAISTPGKIPAKANTAKAVKTIFRIKFIYYCI